ncbi:MAG: hypothetical protein OHK0029_11370 [Armatimonadaceae bacterium]
MEQQGIRWGYPVVAGLPLIVLMGGWIAWSEMRTGVTEITITTLFIAVAFVLFVVTLLNHLVRRVMGERAAMTQPELLVLYSMLSIATALAGIGNIGFFTPFLGNAFWYATDANGWDQWHPLLPAWVGPRDKEVLRGFYEGKSTFFQPEIMRAWAFPLIAWAVFLLVLFWTMLCLSAMLRRRWMDEEHLTFPVVALPLEMTRQDTPLIRNRLLWFGFLIPFFLHSLNTIAGLYPTVPSFPINTAKQLLEGVGPPWNGFGSIMLLVHPAGVGFGYLVNTDILFSLFFFYWLKKSLNFFGTAMNWRDPGPQEYGDKNPEFPFTGYQAWGAWLAVGIAVLWTGRRYFAAYIARALADRPDSRADDGEPMSARQAFWGFLIGFVTLCGIVVGMGASLWLPVAFLGMYILLMLALTRIESETAVLTALLAWVSPQAILTGTIGTANLSRLELSHMASLVWFNQDYRAAVMPHQLQSFVALRRAGTANLRPLIGVLMLSAVVGIVSAMLWDMEFYYSQGAATANVNKYRINMGTVAWWNLSGWLAQPKPPEPMAFLGMGIGAAITVLLTFLRSRFVGFPLAPAGYVLNTTFAHEIFWLDLTIALVVKTAFLRYGGIRMYRNMLPFFLGLILGDFVTGAGWNLFGTLTGLSLFRTFPN